MANIRFLNAQDKIYWLILIPIWVTFYRFVIEDVFMVSFMHGLVESVASTILLILSILFSLNGLSFYTPSKNRFLFVTGVAIVLSIGVVLIHDVSMRYLEHYFEFETIYERTQLMLGAISFMLNGFVLGFSLQMEELKDAQEQQDNQKKAENLKKEAELLKLRHQLQPHFLFNSLNSINALITIQPQEARKMVQQLSSFLRGTIRADEQNLVTIKDELAHLELYLKIEKVRFGHRLNTIIEQDEQSSTKQIPSLLLQPLMENAIKFGLYGTTDLVEIKLHIKYQDHMLEISISNPIDSDVKTQSGTGFGLSSIQRRLYLLYGRTDLLQTHKKETTFTAQLKIPQQA